MSTFVFGLSLVLFLTVMVALAGLVRDMVRAHDETDDACSRVDLALDDEDMPVRRIGGWRW